METRLNKPLQRSGGIFFTVVIPTYGRPDLLRNLLSKLRCQLLTGDEVIVSDDFGDSSKVAELRELFPSIRFVNGPQKGPAANRNAAAAKAATDWLVFLDDDVVPIDDLLAAYREVVANNTLADVIEGRTYSDVGLDESEMEAPVNELGGVLWSCNFAIKKSIFDKLNGFCEYYTKAGGEDIDFYQRLRRVGSNIVFCREASVYHPPRRRASFYTRAMKWRHGVFGRYRWGTPRATILFKFALRLLKYYLVTRPTWTSKIEGVLEAGLVGLCLPYWMIVDYKKWNSARADLVSFSGQLTPNTGSVRGT
jgi:GT2 family glycosyltransferase